MISKCNRKKEGEQDRDTKRQKKYGNDGMYRCPSEPERSNPSAMIIEVSYSTSP